jgi:hypothetical protein
MHIKISRRLNRVTESRAGQVNSGIVRRQPVSVSCALVDRNLNPMEDEMSHLQRREVIIGAAAAVVPAILGSTGASLAADKIKPPAQAPLS